MRLDDEIRALREEISKFRTETRQRLEIIESEVNKQVALNYNRTISDYLCSTTIEIIDSINCDEPELETMCKSQMKEIQEKSLRLMEEGNISESLKELNESISQMRKISVGMRAKGKLGCADCIGKEIEILESNRALLSQIALIESPASSLPAGTITVKGLEPSRVHKNIVNPLANENRIQIILSIFEGENRFSNLSTSTGLHGGQLLYHLRILLENDYIRQFASKDYVLTKKGLKVLVLLTQLNEELY